MQLILQPFNIKFSYGKKSYKALVTQEIKKSQEVFTITHSGKAIQVTSDRPLIAQNPQSRKKPNFKAVNAKVSHQAFYECVIEAIKTHIYAVEHPPQNWNEHSKNATGNPYEQFIKDHYKKEPDEDM